MRTLHESHFELSGEFAGFVRNEKGKRRMLLHTHGEEIFLKVPKHLRKHWTGILDPGHRITVTGVARYDEHLCVAKRTVSTVQVFDRSERIPRVNGSAMTIRVCSKKHCWNCGGHKLWKHLEERIAAEGLEEQVKLKAVGCLGNCKRCPNIMVNRKLVERCSPGKATMLIPHSS